MRLDRPVNEMTVQKRLLIWLTCIAAGAWLVALAGSYWFAHEEVDELFDTRQLTLATQVLAQLPGAGAGVNQDIKQVPQASQGFAEPEDIRIAVWNRAGELISRGPHAESLHFDWAQIGFVNETIDGAAWRVFYLHSSDPARLIAVAQELEERSEVLWALLQAELLPFLFALPILIGGIGLAVYRSFAPLRDLADGLRHRTADDLEPIPTAGVPPDVTPVINSLNSLFERIQTAIEYERRLTADASHELRTPIAGLKAQWDAWSLARDDNARERAASQIGRTIERLSRLVSQLLSLSAIEREGGPRNATKVQWPTVVENALSDVLSQMNQLEADVDVQWPARGDPFPLTGDNAFLSIMLRNLLDNGLRYSGKGARLLVRFGTDEIKVIDNGPGMTAEVAARAGSRFYRPDGQTQAGSGIGLSIVMRIARLHDLNVSFGRDEDPAYPGLAVTVTRKP